MENALQQDQLEAITKMAPPTTVSGLRAFLGTSGYYRRYVPNYHRTTVTLNALLQSGVAWEWTPEAQQAFEELKAKLTTKAQTCAVCHDTAVNRPTGAMLLCNNCNTG
jgi:ribonuclease D